MNKMHAQRVITHSVLYVAGALFLLGGLANLAAAEETKLNVPPKGYEALFNGKDLKRWKGLVANPIKRAKMSAEQLAEAQKQADAKMRAHWSVDNGILVFDGKGKSICTQGDYADFEMVVDWKMTPHGDSGIYLRGSPQVQIWDPADYPEGSGGLYNNKKNPSKPLLCADNPIGEWNTFRIKMIDEKVSVWLNGKLVVHDTVLENYWDRSRPIFPIGQIELQNHHSPLYFRNIFIRPLSTPVHLKKISDALPKKARVKPKKPRKLLVFNRCTRYSHRSIVHASRAIKMMGQMTGAYEAVISEDPAMFDADKLKQFDAIVSNNATGDWLMPSKGEEERMSEEQRKKATALGDQRKKNLIDFVSGGKGFVGIHAATDAHYDWPEFGQMLGGYFDGHPWNETVGIRVEEPDHPLCQVFDGKNFMIEDEIYQFKTPYSRDSLRVLLSIDPSKTNMNKKHIRRTDGDFAIAWVNTFGKGRVFYNALGHRPAIFWNPMILQFYLDGIQFALGDLEAPTAPGP